MFLALIGLALGDWNLNWVYSDKPISLLGWSRSGSVYSAIGERLVESPSGRSLRIPAPEFDLSPWVWTREPRTDRWVTTFGVFDAQDFKLHRRAPHKEESKVVIATFWWQGKPWDLVQDTRQAKTRYLVRSDRREVRLPTEWHFLDISDDGRFFAATKEMPFDGTDLFILEHTRFARRFKAIRRYPLAVDDHYLPGKPLYNATANQFLMNFSTPGPQYPQLLGNTGEKLDTPDRWGSAKWIDPSSNDFLVLSWGWDGEENRRYPRWFIRYLDSMIELRDSTQVKNDVLFRSRMAFMSWVTSDEVSIGGEEIQDWELDFSRKRLAIVLRGVKYWRLVVLPFRLEP